MNVTTIQTAIIATAIPVENSSEYSDVLTLTPIVA